MNKIKIFQEKILEPLAVIIDDDQMQKIKGGIEDKRNRPGSKPMFRKAANSKLILTTSNFY